MEKKSQVDLIVLIVMFVSALLIIVSSLDAFQKAPGSFFVGASIMLGSSLIVRAMQWAGKE